ncbi:MAG: T9SS type A sorting domain-containing protein, partial [Psychroflexus maritimus]
CVATTTFGVSINVTPEIQNLNDLQVCSDFDFTSTFDLTENISEAIGTQDGAEVEIQFFSSLEDAENNENSLSSQEIDMENYPVFEEIETIFIRLQNADSSDCFVVDSFELQSFPVEVNEVDDIEECINSETQQASFDLEEIELTILGANQDSEFYSVVFFDENDELIESTNDFSITSSQTIIAEVFSLENSDCFAQSEVNLIALSPDNPECHLSVEDQVAFEFSTYPNPVVGQLSIDSNQPITQVEIFDIKGKQVYMQRGMDIQNLNFSNYPSGVYMLKMETESSSQIVKIVRE